MPRRATSAPARSPMGPEYTICRDDGPIPIQLPGIVANGGLYFLGVQRSGWHPFAGDRIEVP